MTGRGRGGEQRRKLYKKRGVDAAERRKLLAAEQREQRAERRTAAVIANRGLDVKPVVSKRQQKLEEWRQKKREVVPKVTKENVKPAFVCTKIVYNDSYLYKPPESATFRVPKGVVPIQCQPERELRSRTRNQQKNSAQNIKDAVHNFTSAMMSASKKKNAKKVLKSGLLNTALILKSPQGSQVLQNPFTDFGNVLAEIKVQVPEEENNRQDSGKQSIDGLPTLDNELNINNSEAVKSEYNSAEVVEHGSEKKSAAYFRSLHNEAVAKLNELHNNWTNSLAVEIPDEIRDEIDVAVGYAKLLISQKLQQFQDLISEHENIDSSKELKVLESDLDGFWGMVNKQVQDIYKKFERLETLKQNNWQEISNLKPVKALPQKSRVVKSKGNITSGLRSFLAQARMRAKMGNDENKASPVGICEVEITRPMSPVVMKVASLAKQLGSPKTLTPSLPKRSPLRMVQPLSNNKTVSPPKSARKTPARRKTLLTTSATPLRRSERIQTKGVED